MTIDELKRALLEVSMICGTTKRCSTCVFYNPLALECCMKDLPHRWWVHFLDAKNVDVVLKEDSNATD